MRPNVLLLVMDTARADAFEPYGAPAGSTPAVAQLAGRGVAAAPSHATACWTLPSHASMFTGRLPRSVGLSGAPGGRPQGAAPLIHAQTDRLLPEVLRRAGYATAAISTNLWISRASGFDTGFEEFVSADGQRQWALHGGGLRGRASWMRQSLKARVDDGSGLARETILEWIARARPDSPFFWFVNLVECHSPYLPPRPYNDLGPLERIRAGEEARRHLNLGEIWRTCMTREGIPEGALARMRHLYGRSVRYMDDWLAGVLEALDGRGLLDDTVVIVTSDHGENLGEGGLIGHAFSLDERLLRVPMLFSGPGARDVRPPVSLGELPRFVAELTGLERHPWGQTDAIAGEHGEIALAQFDPPAGRDDPRAVEVAEHWELDEEGLKRLTSRLDLATEGRHKLLRRGEEWLAFELETDPLELNPGTGDSAAFAPLRAAIGERAEIGAAPADPTGDRGTADEISVEERERLEDRMRLLGYL